MINFDGDKPEIKLIAITTHDLEYLKCREHMDKLHKKIIEGFCIPLHMLSVEDSNYNGK